MFFIATLGAIAFYVQRQAVPETNDVVRTAVTAAPANPSDETTVTALPWQDRLDLAALKAVAIGPAEAAAFWLERVAARSSGDHDAPLNQRLAAALRGLL